MKIINTWHWNTIEILMVLKQGFRQDFQFGECKVKIGRVKVGFRTVPIDFWQ